MNTRAEHIRPFDILERRDGTKETVTFIRKVGETLVIRTNKCDHVVRKGDIRWYNVVDRAQL